VTRNYSEDICAVSVDVEKIRVAFLNIIVNAVEAMEPGKGILQLITAGKGDKCVVTTTGISASTAKKEKGPRSRSRLILLRIILPGG
jgi:signal transduction histidine kinase